MNNPTILFATSLPHFPLAAAYFYENIKKLPNVKKIRFIARDYSRFFTEVNSSFVRDILLFKPDIIAFSCFFWNFERNIKLSILAKSLHPGIVTVFGGPQVGTVAQAAQIIKENSSIDAILCGEADFTFPELVRLIIGNEESINLPGLVRRNGDTIYMGQELYYVQDLSELPIIFDDSNEFVLAHINPDGIIPFQTIRGCKNNCSYCLYCINTLRFFPIKRIEKEIAFLCSKKVKHVRICDSHFGGSQARAMELFEIIKFYNKGTTFSIYPDPDHLDRQFIKAARNANCEIISLGLETMDKDVSAEINRKVDGGKISLLLDLLHEQGVYPQVDLIFGLPKQTIESFTRDILFLKNHKVREILFSPLMIFPGTQLSNELNPNKIIILKVPQKYGYSTSMGIQGYSHAFINIDLHQLFNILGRTLKYICTHQNKDVITLEEEIYRSLQGREDNLTVILLDFLEDIRLSSLYIRYQTFSLIHKAKNFLDNFILNTFPKLEFLDEMIRFDILEQAMKTRTRELKQNIVPQILQPDIFFWDDLQQNKWILNEDTWIEKFNVPYEIISGNNKTIRGKKNDYTSCVFFCPSATIYFIDDADFLFLSKFTVPARIDILNKETSTSLAKKWIGCGVLVPADRNP